MLCRMVIFRDRHTVQVLVYDGAVRDASIHPTGSFGSPPRPRRSTLGAQARENGRSHGPFLFHCVWYRFVFVLCVQSRNPSDGAPFFCCSCYSCSSASVWFLWVIVLCIRYTPEYVFCAREHFRESYCFILHHIILHHFSPNRLPVSSSTIKGARSFLPGQVL